MAVILEDKNRDYKRIRPSPAEKMKLRNAGLQWTLSSNISAVGVVDNDLIIRFHNGSLYKYPNNAEHFAPMLRANSKGKYFWRKLRRPGASYIKIGSLPLESDKQQTDDEMFKDIEAQGIRIETPQVLDRADVITSLKALVGVTVLDNTFNLGAIPILK